MAESLVSTSIFYEPDKKYVTFRFLHPDSRIDPGELIHPILFVLSLRTFQWLCNTKLLIK